MASAKLISARVAASICVLASLSACSPRESAPAKPTTATTTSPAPKPLPAPAVPTAEQLVRNYQGEVEDRNGKRWMFLDIHHVTESTDGIRFQYTLNYPNEREDAAGTLQRNGRILLAHLSGRARVDGADVIFESDAIDGLPYWHVAGHPPASKVP
jgi:hypothetical protein